MIFAVVKQLKQLLTRSLSITFLALSLVNNKTQEISLAEKLTVRRHIGARNFYVCPLIDDKH